MFLHYGFSSFALFQVTPDVLWANRTLELMIMLNIGTHILGLGARLYLNAQKPLRSTAHHALTARRHPCRRARLSPGLIGFRKPECGSERETRSARLVSTSSYRTDT